jgi:hypothetical protein
MHDKLRHDPWYMQMPMYTIESTIIGCVDSAVDSGNIEYVEYAAKLFGDLDIGDVYRLASKDDEARDGNIHHRWHTGKGNCDEMVCAMRRSLDMAKTRGRLDIWRCLNKAYERKVNDQGV